MKKYLLISAILAFSKIANAQIEVSNTPTVTPSTNDGFVITQLSASGTVAQATFPNIATALNPWLSFNNLGGQTPATVILVSSNGIGFAIVATNITTGTGSPQTNYVIAPYFTNNNGSYTGIITNESAFSNFGTNRMYFTNGILLKLTYP